MTPRTAAATCRTLADLAVAVSTSYYVATPCCPGISIQIQTKKNRLTRTVTSRTCKGLFATYKKIANRVSRRRVGLCSRPPDAAHDSGGVGRGKAPGCTFLYTTCRVVRWVLSCGIIISSSRGKVSDDDAASRKIFFRDNTCEEEIFNRSPTATPGKRRRWETAAPLVPAM